MEVNSVAMTQFVMSFHAETSLSQSHKFRGTIALCNASPDLTHSSTSKMVRTTIFLTIFGIFIASAVASPGGTNPVNEHDGEVHPEKIDFELDRMVDETIAEIPDYELNVDAHVEDDDEALPHVDREIEEEETLSDDEENMDELPDVEHNYQDDIPHAEDTKEDDTVSHVSRKLLATETVNTKAEDASKKVPKIEHTLHEAEKVIRTDSEHEGSESDVYDQDGEDFDDESIPESVRMSDDEDMDEDEDYIDPTIHIAEAEKYGHPEDEEDFAEDFDHYDDGEEEE